MVRRKGPSKNSAQNFNRPTTDVPEDEQWRLVNESGILHKVSSIPTTQATNDEDDVTPLVEEIFGAVLLIIPFSFLLLMMEMFVSFSPCVLTLTDIFFGRVV